MPKIQTGDMEKWRVELRLFVTREQKRFAIANQSHIFDEIVLNALEKNKHVDIAKENYIKLESVDEESVKNLEKFLERSLEKCQQREQHDLIQQSLRKTLQNSRRQTILMQQNTSGLGAPIEPFCLFCASNLATNGQLSADGAGQRCADHQHHNHHHQQAHHQAAVEAAPEEQEIYIEAHMQLPPTPPVAPTPPIPNASIYRPSTNGGAAAAANGSVAYTAADERAILQAKMDYAVMNLTNETDFGSPQRQEHQQRMQHQLHMQQQQLAPPVVQLVKQQPRPVESQHRPQGPAASNGNNLRAEPEPERNIKVDGSDSDSDFEHSRKLVISSTPVQPPPGAARMVASVQPSPSPTWTGIKMKKTRKKAARSSWQANGRKD